MVAFSVGWSLRKEDQQRKKIIFPLLGLVLPLLLLAVLLASCARFQAQDQFERGLDLFQRGQFQQAGVFAGQAVESSPENPVYRGLWGWTWIRQGDLEKARRQFEVISAKNPDHPGGIQGLAWLAYMENRFEKARPLFLRQLEWAQGLLFRDYWSRMNAKDQNYVLSMASDAHYGLGLCAAGEEDWAGAAVQLEKALETRNDFSGHGPVYLALADALCRLGRMEEAQNRFGEAEKAGADGTMEANAWCLYYTGQYGGALRAFLKMDSSAGRPGFARSTAHGIVLCAVETGQMDLARDWSRRLIQRDPEYAHQIGLYQAWRRIPQGESLQKDLGLELAGRGLWKEAAPNLAAFLSGPGGEKGCEAELAHAWCLLHTGQKEASRQAFQGMLKNRKCNPSKVLTGLGVSAIYLDLPVDARNALNAAVEADPDNLRARLALGAVAYQVGDYEDAVDVITRYQEEIPKKEVFFSWPSHAWNNLGWSYYYLGRFQDAAEVFSRLDALHLPAGSARARAGLGWSQYRMGRVSQARESFERALALDPENQSARRGLEQILDTDES